METLTNIEFQDRVKIGDILRLSSHKHWVKFLGYQECNSTNNLCKECKGHIKYAFSNGGCFDDINNGCFRYGSTVALIEVEIKSVWLNEEDFLL